MSDHNYTYYSELQPNDVVLVLGATKGDFMKERLHEIRQKNVFVINVEPTLEGIHELSTFIKQHLPENACVVSAAVSDFTGITTMDIRDNLITSTLESRPETNERWPMQLLYKTKVPTVTLDCLLLMFPKIDKVFCDIEGSEIEVFNNLRFTENATRIPYFAIAAYHLRDGEETWKRLSEMFPGYEIKVDGEPSFHKHEVVFFAIKR